MTILIFIQTIIYLATLISVIIQTRKLSKTLDLNMHQDILNNLNKLDEIIINNQELAGVFNEKTEEVTNQQKTFLYLVFNLLDSLYSKFELSVVDYHTWLPWRYWIIDIMKKKVIYNFWISAKSKKVFTTQFMRFIDGLRINTNTQIGDFKENCTIIIPFKGDINILNDCLNALLYSEHLPKILVISDGLNQKGFQTIQDSFKNSDIEFHEIISSGPSRARNYGLQRSQTPFVFFIDHDIVVGEETIIELYNSIILDENIAGVQSLFLPLSPGLISNYESSEYWLNYISSSNHHVYSNQLHTHCVIYRRDIIWDIGGFNEDFLEPGGEDTDLSFKIFNHGFKLIINSDSVVYHHNSTNIYKYLRKRITRVKARAKLYTIHPSKILTDKAIIGSLSFLVYTIFALYLKLAIFLLLIFFVFRLIRISILYFKYNFWIIDGLTTMFMLTIRDIVFFSFPYFYVKEVLKKTN